MLQVYGEGESADKNVQGDLWGLSSALQMNISFWKKADVLITDPRTGNQTRSHNDGL